MLNQLVLMSIISMGIFGSLISLIGMVAILKTPYTKNLDATDSKC